MRFSFFFPPRNEGQVKLAAEPNEPGVHGRKDLPAQLNRLKLEGEGRGGALGSRDPTMPFGSGKRDGSAMSLKLKRSSLLNALGLKSEISTTAKPLLTKEEKEGDGPERVRGPEKKIAACAMKDISTLSPETIAQVAQFKSMCHKANVQLRSDLEAFRFVSIAQGNLVEAIEKARIVRELETTHKLDEISEMEAFDKFVNNFGQALGISGRDKEERPIVAGLPTFEILKEMFSGDMEQFTIKYLVVILRCSTTTLTEFHQGICAIFFMENVSLLEIHPKSEAILSKILRSMPFQAWHVFFKDLDRLQMKVVQKEARFDCSPLETRSDVTGRFGTSQLPIQSGIGKASLSKMRKIFQDMLQRHQWYESAFVL